MTLPRLNCSSPFRFSLACLVLAGFAGSKAVAGGLPCRYDVTAVIDSPFADDIVRGEAINNHNEVCGTFTVGFSNDRPFYWTPQGGFVAIPLPPGVLGGKAHDLSDAGLVVGVMSYSGGQGSNRGFIYDIHTGAMTTLFTEHGQGTCEITGVNEAGVVCGFRSVNDGGDVFWPVNAFRWSPQTGFEDMAPGPDSQLAFAINESNTVTGIWYPSGVIHAFRWRANGTIEDMPTLSGMETRGAAINDLDVTVGTSAIPLTGFPHGAPRAVRIIGNQITNLGTLPGFAFSFADDLNNSGTSVGYAHAVGTTGMRRAVIWDHGILRDLNQFNDNLN